jgi:prepilin-type N-terminal cleavage/methylation domain-containing protein
MMTVAAQRPRGWRGERGRVGSAAGFSLLEVLVVVAILLTLIALATPSLIRAINTYRLESTARNVSSLIQRTRFEAMRRNRTTCTRFQLAGAEGRYFMNLQGAPPDPCTEPAPTADPGEPAVVTPGNIVWYSGGAPALPPDLDGLPPGYAATLLPGYGVTFSPRGVAIDAAGNMVNQIQAICLLGQPGVDFPNVNQAVLITVTPTGSVKLFRWERSATAWVQM